MWEYKALEVRASCTRRWGIVLWQADELFHSLVEEENQDFLLETWELCEEDK